MINSRSNSYLGISLKTWVILFILYSVPPLCNVVDKGDYFFHNIFWFFYLTPTLIIVYHKGTMSGVLATIISSLLLVVFESLEPEGFGSQEIIILSILLIMNLQVSLMVGMLVKRNARKQHELMQTQNRLESIFNHLDIAIWSIQKNKQVFFSKGIEKIYGLSRDKELRNQQFWKKSIHPDDLSIAEEIDKKWELLEDYEYEYRIKRPNGEIRWIRDRGIPVFKADGSLERYDGTNDDITIHKELEFSLKESEERYKNLVEEALVGVYMIQDSELVYVNQWITSFLGKKNQELLGTNFYQLINSEDKKRIITNFQKLIDGQLTFLIDEIQTTSQDGSTKFLAIQAALTSNNGASAIIGIALDVTEEKKTKAELEYLAFHDTLTGLPNMKYLNHSIVKDFNMSKDLEIPVSIMFLSLDRFKLINDSFGHHVGDQLLMMISKRLIDSIQQMGEVIRAGGDEFIIYFPNTNERQALDVTEFLLTIFTDRFELNEQEIQLSASIGIAHLQPNDTFEELIQKASSALHVAKALGGNRYRVYSSEFGERANRRLQLEQSLRKAFAEKELEIVYQPKLDLFTNQLTGMEALARWKDPFLGSVSPNEFIPIAEETGMIISIGKWILETACNQNSNWQRNGSSTVHVCVNISSIQFSQDDFVNMVEHVLKASGLAPEYLNLEITEGIALANVDDTIKKLMQLKQLGVSISLDDFGTGYSSLSYLKSLPIDYLKIDRSFITGITKSSQDAAIIDSIISLSHTLSLKVVAEGVEDEQQLKALKEMGCDEIQGFYYAKPMSATGLEAFLSVNQRQS